MLGHDLPDGDEAPDQEGQADRPPGDGVDRGQIALHNVHGPGGDRQRRQNRHGAGEGDGFALPRGQWGVHKNPPYNKNEQPIGCPITGRFRPVIQGLSTAALVWNNVSRSPGFRSSLGAPSRFPNGLLRFAPCYSDGFASDLHRIPFSPLRALTPRDIQVETLYRNPPPPSMRPGVFVQNAEAQPQGLRESRSCPCICARAAPPGSTGPQSWRHVGMPPYEVRRGCGRNRGPVRADIQSAPTGAPAAVSSRRGGYQPPGPHPPEPPGLRESRPCSGG